MRIVTLATFPTSAQAELVRGRLLGHGIEARLGGDLMGTVLGGYLGAAGIGVQVLVREEDLERATAVLDGQGAEGWIGEVFGGEEEESWACPGCGVDVDGHLDTCWACGTTQEGEADPDFTRPEGADGGTDWEAEPEPASDRDVFAGRALRYAVVGTVLLPPVFHLVSLVLLLRLVTSPGALSPKGRRHAFLALFMDTLMLVASVLLFRAIVGSSRHGIG